MRDTPVASGTVQIWQEGKKLVLRLDGMSIIGRDGMVLATSDAGTGEIGRTKELRRQSKAVRKTAERIVALTTDWMNNCDCSTRGRCEGCQLRRALGLGGKKKINQKGARR